MLDFVLINLKYKLANVPAPYNIVVKFFNNIAKCWEKNIASSNPDRRIDRRKDEQMDGDSSQTEKF